MTEQLPNSISTIRESTPKLNATIDKANRAVADVEKFLNEVGAGIPASIKFIEEDDQQVYLEYVRLGDKFRIAISYYLPHKSEHVAEPFFSQASIKPWSECARADKLDAFDRLPDLLNVVANEIQRYIIRTEKTVQTVDAVMTALQSSERQKGMASSAASMESRVAEMAETEAEFFMRETQKLQKFGPRKK